MYGKVVMKEKQTAIISGSCDRRSEERGAVIVEFSFVALLFFMTLIMLVEVGRVSYQYLSAQFLITHATQFANIGGNDPQASDCVQDRVDEVRAFLASFLDPRQVANFHVPMDVNQVVICPVGNICTPATSDTGVANQFIQVRVDIPVRLVYFQTGITLRAAAIGRNEPFPNPSC